VPSGLSRGELVGKELVSKEQDDAQEAEEAGSRPVHGPGAPVALRLKAEVGACLFEGNFDLPATEIPREDHLPRDALVGAEEGGEWVGLAGGVGREQRGDGERVFAVAVPQSALCGDLHWETLAAVPVDLGGEPGRLRWVRLR